MTVAVEARRIGEVPVLVARPAGVAPPLPLVLWFHGFRADSAGHRPELERVASAGFLAVGVDAVGHGARRDPDLDARVARHRDDVLPMVLDMVEATAVEVPGLVRALAAEEIADPARVSVAGISMGGYLVYRAVVAEPSIRTAVALLGSPEWPVGDSPHRHAEAFRRVALLSITAEHDENVPPAEARRFHEALAARHPAPERARYLELAGAEHLMSAEHWRVAMDETVGWLGRFGR